MRTSICVPFYAGTVESHQENTWGQGAGQGYGGHGHWGHEGHYGPIPHSLIPASSPIAGVMLVVVSGVTSFIAGCLRFLCIANLIQAFEVEIGMSQGLLWETSLLDPEEGIRFRGYSIPELQVTLPPRSSTFQIVATHFPTAVPC